MWPDHRLLDLLKIELPIIQAPMAGPVLADMVIAVSEAGGLGSLPCALMSAVQARSQIEQIRRGTSRPINLNFFCHTPPADQTANDAAWKKKLAPFYAELGVDPEKSFSPSQRAPFDDEFCSLVEQFKPEVVSFHFGLPEPQLLSRVMACGAKVLASATTVDEARWLVERGAHAIIAQGAEAGGHRGNFLSDDISTQVGTIALVPQIVDAVDVPVIAAGGLSDGRGIAATFALGAAGAQVGTAYLFCPEAKISAAQSLLLKSAKDNNLVITNVFTGRPARGVVNRFIREAGPMTNAAPPFPLAGGRVTALRSAAEAKGSTDFTLQWAGQAVRLGRALPAGDLTRLLAKETLQRLGELSPLSAQEAE